ncbi:integrase [Paraburkholderia sp. MM6662-R1]
MFRFAIKEGYCKTDPARDLVGAIPPAQTTHFASITEPAKVSEMLRAFDAFSGTFPVLCALRLAPMLFVRPGERRQAEWAQIDLEGEWGEWRYRVTKTNTDHLVPLVAQAVAILRELRALTGSGRYVFPGARDAHAVPDNLGSAYNRTKFIRERREMMQEWADYRDRIKAGAEVIPIKGGTVA